jgi:hypothetical protein
VVVAGEDKACLMVENRIEEGRRARAAVVKVNSEGKGPVGGGDGAMKW